jgi:hypothetical protein
MRLRLLLIGVAALAVAVPAALAAYPAPYAAQGGDGVTSPNGVLHYVAYDAGKETQLSAIRWSDLVTLKSKKLDGAFGVPMVTSRQQGGMFRDGTKLVLQSVGSNAETGFRIVDTTDLSVLNSISLKGTFAFDALSPDGRKLYLIQHSSAQDLQHYVVRLYDLAENALMPGKIADRAQKGWVMSGWPAARTTTVDGRWVYTLYINPGGFPFVHALDTVKGVAHCVGFRSPSTDQSVILNYTLAAKGAKVLVRRDNGTLYRVINRNGWKVTTR